MELHPSREELIRERDKLNSERIFQAHSVTRNEAKGLFGLAKLRKERIIHLNEKIAKIESQLDNNHDNQSTKTTESTMNIISLIALAENVNDDLTPATVPANLRDAFERAATKRREETQERAVQTIMELMDRSETTTNQLVSHLRSLRRQEKLVRQKIEEIETARQYAEVTSNYIPWCSLVGLSIPYDTDLKLLKVPEGWTPPATK